jgi:hypothetical protein
MYYPVCSRKEFRNCSKPSLLFGFGGSPGGKNNTFKEGFWKKDWVSVIKRRIDQSGENGQYLLTGSQQWSVLKSLSESLAGRAAFVDMDGFMLRETARSSAVPWLKRWLESSEKFILSKKQRLKLPHSLNETLWRGGLPRSSQLPLNQVPDFFAAYQRTYIEKDVRLVADVSDVQLFSGAKFRLFRATQSKE